MTDKELLLEIAGSAISEMNAGKLLQKKIQNFQSDKKLFLISIGKAAWQMAETAVDILGSKIEKGIVITKYDHSQGDILNCQIFEAGHPLPDENSLKATEYVLKEVEHFTPEKEVLFLISGGGSALFEKPLPEISLKDLIEINRQLINSGATINEINTVRKHLSEVKGGRFADKIKPARIHTFILSDVIGDDVSLIASGPASADPTTSEQALGIITKYRIRISEKARKAIQEETPKVIKNADHKIIGNVELLCRKAAEIALRKGFQAKMVKTDLQEDVVEVSELIWQVIKTETKKSIMRSKPVILISGGEPVINVSGNGKGGRNQHLALLMAKKIAGIKGVTFLSIASDGTDGPTDAAGGIVTGYSLPEIYKKQIDPEQEIKNCNSYFVLSKIKALIKTGPSGTNVNDLMLVLID